MAAAVGWVATSQLDQFLLDVPLDLDLVRPGRLCLAIHGGRQPLGDELLAHPGDGARANAKSSDIAEASPSTFAPVAVEMSLRICSRLEFVASMLSPWLSQTTEAGEGESKAGHLGFSGMGGVTASGAS